MGASEFINISHGFYPLLEGLLLCEDKEGEDGWSVQNFMLESLVANNALTIQKHINTRSNIMLINAYIR